MNYNINRDDFVRIMKNYSEHKFTKGNLADIFDYLVQGYSQFEFTPSRVEDQFKVFKDEEEFFTFFKEHMKKALDYFKRNKPENGRKFKEN